MYNKLNNSHNFPINLITYKYSFITAGKFSNFQICKIIFKRNGINSLKSIK